MFKRTVTWIAENAIFAMSIADNLSKAGWSWGYVSR